MSSFIQGVDPAVRRALLDVERRLAPTQWTAVTFQNSWANYGSGYQVAQFRKVGDVVQLRGLILGGAVDTVAFTLPVGFRPPAILVFPSDKDNTVHGRLDVFPSGGVIPRWAGGTNAYFSLDGVQFSVTP